jgi:hypothetical protein
MRRYNHSTKGADCDYRYDRSGKGAERHRRYNMGPKRLACSKRYRERKTGHGPSTEDRC